MNYLIALLLNSLYIVGFWYSFQDGQILSKLNPYPYINKLKSDNILLKEIFKPVIGCVVCMASVHGLLFLYVFKNYLQLDIYVVVFYIFALAGMNRIIYKIADL